MIIALYCSYDGMRTNHDNKASGAPGFSVIIWQT